MSSHHIIRENQEPALVILSMIGPEIINQLLEWSPKIFCHYTLLDSVKEAGFKIDVIIGPKNSEEESMNKMEYQMPVEYESYKESWEEILGKIKNQTIHIASNKEIFIASLKSDSEIIRYSDDFKEYPIKGEWKKWKNKGDKIELSTQPLETINLKRNHSEYSVIQDGMVKIRCNDEIMIREFFVL